MADSILSLHAITKVYGSGEQKVVALDSVTVSFARGEFTAVVGPSGSGKTTLLNIIGCLDSPTSGTIAWEGSPMSSMSRAALAAYRREHVAFIFQTYNLIPVLDVVENVELPLIIAGARDRPALRRKVLDMLALVGLSDKAQRRPAELSGGQEQRVAIARALVKDPTIVLADEPTANLDSRTAHEIVMLMREINQKLGTTFLFSTHDPRMMEHARRVITLMDGRIAADEGRS